MSRNPLEPDDSNDDDDDDQELIDADSDVWFCTNCGPVTNVSTAGTPTCLDCGDTLTSYQ